MIKATADVMTPDEVCTYIGISRPTLFKMFREGKLPRIHVHQRRIFTPRIAVDRFLGIVPAEKTAA